MNATSLLTLVSLAVLTTQASAAPSQSESNVVVLPPYTVVAPHSLPVEQQVNASLNELRQQARNTVYNPVTMPLVRNSKLGPASTSLACLDAKELRVAKL